MKPFIMTASLSASRILCVDDDPNMLMSVKLNLRRFFQVEAAASAEEGLIALKQKGPFAVILSDMNMPGMDGSSFLNEASFLAPDTVRIMITGDSDQKTALRAVNEGHVFQLVNKPCDPTTLAQTVVAAVRQHQLIIGEKELLEQTLKGCVKLLTDILAMADPASFGKAQLLRDYVHSYLDQNKEANSSRWEIEMAAMLSNLGHVIIPRPILEKVEKASEVSEAEQQILDRVPETGFALLENIPRLHVVANIVRYQDKNYDGSGLPNDNLGGEEIPYGARIVKVLKDLIEKEAAGLSRTEAIACLDTRTGNYDPKILQNCATSLKFHATSEQMAEQVSTILIAELTNKHVLVSPLVTKEGMLVAPSGTEISNLILERIRNFSTLHDLVEPIHVKMRIHRRN
jgi:response regulator RpfG family c-di-GMP phosphodiesterase